MTQHAQRRLVPMALALALVLPACGSSSGDTPESSTTTAAPSTTSTSGAVTTTEAATTTTLPPLPGACPDRLTTTQGVVIGVEDWVRIRLGPTTASAEIGRFDAGSTVTLYRDTLSYDGSDYWWVTVQVPATGACGSVAANFLTDRSGRLDQQIPGLSYQAPTSSGTWTYPARSSFRDPIEGSLNGAFFTTYSVTVGEGMLIEQLLADQLSEFQEFEYDYPAQWNTEVLIPGADRAVRLIPIVSGSGDLTINRLLVEIGEVTVEVTTSVYIEDLGLAPLDDLAAFLDSVSFDKPVFLAAVSP